MDDGLRADLWAVVRPTVVSGCGRRARQQRAVERLGDIWLDGVSGRGEESPARCSIGISEGREMSRGGGCSVVAGCRSEEKVGLRERKKRMT